MASQLDITLLGDFRIIREGRELIALHGRRRRELLALLVLRPGVPISRDHLSFQLWPDSTEAQARTNLRQLLHRLKRELPDAERFLALDGPTIRWREGAPAAVDVHELERAWHEAEKAAECGEREGETAALLRTLALYPGSLLPGFYDRWVEEERERLRRRTLGGLARLVTLLEEERRYGEAVDAAERLGELDPFREETILALIRLHALQGNPAKGLAVFRRFARFLGEELGAAPTEETAAFAERIRSASPLRTARRSDPGTGVLVGRRRQWRAILEAWGGVLDGGVRLVLLTGEPGIGKTRLAEEFLSWAERQGFAAAAARAHPGEGSIPYDPVAQWLSAEPLLASALALDRPRRTEVARVVPAAAPPGDVEESWAAAEGEWRRLRLFEALAQAVRRVERPTVLVLDDVQWCDRETLDWVTYLFRSDRPISLMVLATVRPGEPPTVKGLPRWREALRAAGWLIEIPLPPLEPEETRRLAEERSSRTIAPHEARALHARTEGNPLFIVESLRAEVGRVEQSPAGQGGKGSTSPADLAPGSMGVEEQPPLPARIQGVIRHRFEQLSAEGRELLGLAAVLGRRFDVDIVGDAASDRFDEGDVVRVLDELAARHLVREAGALSYEFTHDRIREVAEEELGTARRRLLHRHVAEALERATGKDPRLAGSAVARHFERAGLPVRAVPHYRRAAEQALAVYAHEEAVAHLDRALALLQGEPDSADRRRHELELQIARGVPLVAIHHYAGEPVREAYGRARELAEGFGEAPEPPVLRGLALSNLIRSRIGEVMELGRRLLHQAEERRDSMLRVEAHYVLGVALYWQGRIPAARVHLETSLRHYDPQRARSHLRLYAQDPAVISRVRLALALWHQGEPTRARKMVGEALVEARALEHPFTLAYARYFGSWVLIESGAMDEARKAVRGLRREASEHSLSVWPDLAAILDAWLEVMGSGSSRALERMEAAAVAYREAGLTLGFPYHAALLARACLRLGSPERGLRHLEAGLRMSQETGERFWDAELERLRGVLLRESGGDGQGVARALEAAREIARSQEARSLELRASLTHARRGVGEGGVTAELRSELERLVAAFPPGEDTPDVSGARAFLSRAEY